MCKEKTTINTDIIIIGGSIGGVIAAYAAASRGKNVVLTEKTDWLGGQFTSQAVPPDEHQWIESQGCTRTYRDFRNKLRQHYLAMPHFKAEMKPVFNPGSGLVSNISHEPRVGLKILEEMLAPFVSSKKITVLLNTVATKVIRHGTQIKEVVAESEDKIFSLSGKFFLDATDCGDLLPLAGLRYFTGAESKKETGELHAAETSNSQDIQPSTYVAAIDYNPKQQDVSMEKPTEYEFFKKQMLPFDTRYSVLSWYAANLNDGKSRRFVMFDGEKDEAGNAHFPLFHYRQIVKAANFTDGSQPFDITLVNWPQNDYFFGNIYDSEDADYNLYMSKQLTLSLIYFFNTEAKREGGKVGYRGFNLRGDVLGTTDGLAKAPYIRESRRIDSLKRVTENMICKELNAGLPHFEDTVGVGSYHIDVHITTKTNSFFFYEVQPFEIPLSAMIPKDAENLIASCKNIGATHLTNGCYRLHPIEWNIGEAAGYLAAYCLDRGIEPKEVALDAVRLKEFQSILQDNGVQLRWQL